MESYPAGKILDRAARTLAWRGGDRKETWRFVDTCESSEMEIREFEGGDRNRRKFFRKEKVVEWIEVATVSIICYFKQNFGKSNDNWEFFLFIKDIQKLRNLFQDVYWIISLIVYICYNVIFVRKNRGARRG